jgi:hypothetical protein
MIFALLSRSELSFQQSAASFQLKLAGARSFA